MKNFLILLALAIMTGNAYAVCSSPISRTNNGTNTVLTSTKYNLDLNTVYNKVNNLPGDCLVDDSLNGSKLIDSTVTAAKLASNSVTTAKIADGSITAAKLAAAIENLVPVGTILTFGGDVAPSGYMLGQGQSLSRTTYANLFAVFGTKFGSADGNSFNNVDCRGRTVRYVDGGVNLDPDRASRAAMNTGGAVGDNVGSVQNDQFGSHRHLLVTGIQAQNTSWSWANGYQYLSMGYPNGSTSDYAYAVLGRSEEPNQYYSSASGGNETRMDNFGANCIVKI